MTLEQPVCEAVADVCAAAISPDGRTLLIEVYKNRTAEIGTWLVDLADGSRGALEGAYYPSWVDGSNLLLFERNGKSIDYRVVTVSGDLKWRGTLPEDLGHYSLSPDAKSLAGLVATAAPAAPD